MSKKIRFCKTCRNNMTPKFYGYWAASSEDNFICPICKNEMAELNLLSEDFWVIRHTSKDINFLEAMIKLHDEDIIAYEEKMSTFRANDQWYQEKYNPKPEPKEDSNVPKCPTCGSTRIQKISGSRKLMGAIGFGLRVKPQRVNLSA